MKEIEEFAKLFHDIYEKLAPDFGYHTRPEYREWNTNTNNAQLMMAVCEIVLAEILKRFGEKDKEIKHYEKCDEVWRNKKNFLEEELAKAYKKIAELEAQVDKLQKYKMFFESCSCLFAEGVEMMTKTEIYEQIKKETKQLERG